jgi:hypothetical protein
MLLMLRHIGLTVFWVVPVVISPVGLSVNAFIPSVYEISSHALIVGTMQQQFQPNKLCYNRADTSISMRNDPRDDSISGTYDLSKPIFDVYAMRMIRNDAIIQYNLRNQSEPLRINLALLGTLFLLCLPSLIVEFSGTSSSLTVIPTTVPLVTTDLSVTIPQTIASWIGAVGCFTIAIQQSQKRNKQLSRIEKECMAGDLFIQLPMTWIGSDRPYQTQPISIRNVIKTKNCRVVAMSGPTNALQSTLQNELVIYNRRWIQSNTYWVLIPTDISTSNQPTKTFVSKFRYTWLVQAYDTEIWNTYVQSLQSDKYIHRDDDSQSISWFGLSATGRSFGSGTTKPISYLQLLGNSLSPVDILFNDLDEKELNVAKDKNSDSIDVTDLLLCQQRFYDALTIGNLTLMDNDVFDNTMTDEMVTNIIQQGGRLDPWDQCLLSAAKPTGMTISDREVIILPDNSTTAYTTCIEFPIDTYMGDRNVLPTLLAVQKWQRTVNKTNETWKLVLHQTIPWTNDRRPAGGTLICDCRGCVALVRSTERQKK